MGSALSTKSVIYECLVYFLLIYFFVYFDDLSNNVIAGGLKCLSVR